MRKIVVLFLTAAVAAPSFAAPAGSAQNFLDRANRLKAKGPMALFDADYKKLKAEAMAAGNRSATSESRLRKPARRSSIAHRSLGRSWDLTNSSMGSKPFRRTSAQA